MNDTKSPFQSLTLGGASMSLVGSLFTAFGIQMDPGLGTNINAVVTGIGAAIAIYGRLRATRKIGKPSA